LDSDGTEWQVSAFPLFEDEDARSTSRRCGCREADVQASSFHPPLTTDNPLLPLPPLDEQEENSRQVFFSCYQSCIESRCSSIPILPPLFFSVSLLSLSRRCFFSLHQDVVRSDEAMRFSLLGSDRRRTGSPSFFSPPLKAEQAPFFHTRVRTLSFFPPPLPLFSNLCPLSPAFFWDCFALGSPLIPSAPLLNDG